MNSTYLFSTLHFASVCLCACVCGAMGRLVCFCMERPGRGSTAPAGDINVMVDAVVLWAVVGHSPSTDVEEKKKRSLRTASVIRFPKLLFMGTIVF